MEYTVVCGGLHWKTDWIQGGGTITADPANPEDAKLLDYYMPFGALRPGLAAPPEGVEPPTEAPGPDPGAPEEGGGAVPPMSAGVVGRRLPRER